VNLPKAATSQKDLKENLNLTLTQAGELLLNREPIMRQDLGPRLKSALASEPELMVIMNADGAVRHSTVIDVLDELRLSGVTRLAIAVNPDKKP
jgi:biopolymer transport protein ExbD